MSTRTTVLWVPDWPVVAATEAEQVPLHLPAAVHDARRVTAVSALARAQGVRRGMRRRQAQGCCPELVLIPIDEGRDVRLFEPVAAAVETVVAGVEVVRAGLLLLPAGGASRYHGSEEVLSERLVTAVAEQTGHEAHVGTADGLLASILAARTGSVVEPGASRGFLASRGVEDLAHAAVQDGDLQDVAELVDLLGRLGLRTLGDLAALPAGDVHARFGRLGASAGGVPGASRSGEAGVRRHARGRRPGHAPDLRRNGFRVGCPGRRELERAQQARRRGRHRGRRGAAGALRIVVVRTGRSYRSGAGRRRRRLRGAPPGNRRWLK